MMTYFIIAYFWANSLLSAFFFGQRYDFATKDEKWQHFGNGILGVLFFIPVIIGFSIAEIGGKINTLFQLKFFFMFWFGDKFSNLDTTTLNKFNRMYGGQAKGIRRRIQLYALQMINKRHGFIYDKSNDGNGEHQQDF